MKNDVAGVGDPVDTGRKLNVHKTFRKRPGRLLNVLRTFSLRPVSMEEERVDAKSDIGKEVDTNSNITIKKKYVQPFSLVFGHYGGR